MQPVLMSILLLLAWGAFAWQMIRRWRLMRVASTENRFDRIGERLRRTWVYAFAQKRMRRYWWAGIAHGVIFGGFIVLMLRSLLLFGRGYSRSFDLFGLLAEGAAIGNGYAFLKDFVAVLVILAAVVFVYYRVVRRLPRMTLSFEGLLILIIIEAMMFGDILHDGTEIVLAAISDGSTVSFAWHSPAGSAMALSLAGLGEGTLTALSHLGFWTHVGLVLLFLNLLPISKHFHVITAIPNVFFQDLSPRGRLANIEDIEGKLQREETLGLARIDQLHWKDVLDLYTCTECGRCTDHCPAAATGKMLSPKQLTLDLRDHLYANEKHLVAAGRAAGAATGVASDGEAADSGDASAAEATDSGSTSAAERTDAGNASETTESPVGELIPNIINPEVIWACTTCGACETECPVFIPFVDKIIDMRRNLVMEKAEFPSELQNLFRGLETNANPWSFPAADRAAWAEGLDVPLISDKPAAAVLFWVGCSPSYDHRARKIARATANLLKKAGVDFAILGPEEQCTGDPARRAGNEYLFQMLAKANVETLNGHNVRKIVTTCPHCFNTLLNEYPDFGGKYEVVHHADFLTDLLRQGKLKPIGRVDARVVYHDSCYLGRYNDIYESPREMLKSIPGLTVLEPAATRDRGLCCGAGGAQMFKEEESGDERVNIRRTEQLLETEPDAVATACPFCQRMLLDGLAEKGRESVEQYDIAELLWKSVEPAATT